MFLWMVLLFLLLLTAIVARATTLVPMSFKELTRRATAIEKVRCISVQSVWSGGEIWTDSRFQILEEDKADVFGSDQFTFASAAGAKVGEGQTRGTWDGAAARAIVVRQLGGSIAGLHSRVEGVPEFAPGEEIYLFLWRRTGEGYRVLGWSQGTFRITQEQRGGAVRLTQDSAMSAFQGETREFQARGVRNMPLAAFQQKLRQALSASRR
jgi:hypothetical protein